MSTEEQNAILIDQISKRKAFKQQVANLRVKLEGMRESLKAAEFLIERMLRADDFSSERGTLQGVPSAQDLIATCVELEVARTTLASIERYFKETGTFE